MPTKEKTILEQIREASQDLETALIDNVEALKAETDAKVRVKKAHYNILKAKQRMHAIEMDLYA